MPIYVLECRYKDGAAGPRSEHLDAHRAYLAEHEKTVRLAGPFLSDSDQPIGSLIFLSCPSVAEAAAFRDDDPLGKAGVFESVVIREFEAEIGSEP
jgi:hypothetical protein